MATPQTSRFHDLLRRLTLAKDLSYPSVLEDLFPVLDLLADKPELFRARGERPFWGNASHVGAAGTTPRIELRNPLAAAGQPASSLLAVVTHLILCIEAGGPGVVELSLGADVLAGFTAGGSGQVSGTDGRDPLPNSFIPRSGLLVAGDTPVAGQPGPYRIPLALNAPLLLPVRIIFPPGWGLFADLAAVGVNRLTVNYMGYERNTDPTELT